MKTTSYEVCFETLANSLRLRIIKLLTEEMLSVGEISKKLKAEQSRVSHSLRTLKDCGYVESKARGKERIYSLSREFKEKIGSRPSDKKILEAVFSHLCACEKFCKCGE